jgi:hypothetical protein
MVTLSGHRIIPPPGLCPPSPGGRQDRLTPPAGTARTCATTYDRCPLTPLRASHQLARYSQPMSRPELNRRSHVWTVGPIARSAAQARAGVVRCKIVTHCNTVMELHTHTHTHTHTRPPARHVLWRRGAHQQRGPRRRRARPCQGASAHYSCLGYPSSILYVVACVALLVVVPMKF